MAHRDTAQSFIRQVPHGLADDFQPTRHRINRLAIIRKALEVVAVQIAFDHLDRFENILQA